MIPNQNHEERGRSPAASLLLLVPLLLAACAGSQGPTGRESIAPPSAGRRDGGSQPIPGARPQSPQPGAEIAGMELNGLTLDFASLVFAVEVSNPLSAPLTLTALDYTVESGGRAVASGSSPYRSVIAAGTAEIIPITARVAFSQVRAALGGLSPGATVPYAAQVGISVEAPGAGSMRLPVNATGSFPVPAVPTVSLKQVKWESLSLSDASAVLRLEVGNGNSFSLDVDGLSYSLNLAGAHVLTAHAGQPLSLEAGKTGILEFPISFKPSELGGPAFEKLTGAGARYSMEGTLDTLTPFGLMALPFSGRGETVFTR